MSCPGFDWKAYVLGELEADAREDAAKHLEVCAGCQAEVAQLEVTVTAITRLPQVAPPRRIAFVSDPVFEQGWWARLWASGPRLGFASAAMLSLAILVHGFAPRAETPAQTAQITQTDMDARVQAELDRRLPEAVQAKVRAELQPAMAEFSKKLHEFETGQLADVKRHLDRKADIRDVRSAFELIDKRISTQTLSAARYGGD